MIVSDHDDDKDEDMTQTEDETIDHAQYRATYYATVAESWRRAVNDALANHAVPLEALGGNELAYQRGCRDVIVEIERWQKAHLLTLRSDDDA
jgi:hypothetical protein